MASFLIILVLLASILAQGVTAAPPLARVHADREALLERDEALVGPRQGSCHTPSNRACWSPGFDIFTDYEVNTPNTGVVRTYTFDITEVDGRVGPDGVVKEKLMLINDNIVGPTVFANWGDTIEVTVNNNLQTNGTSIHWHGLHQKGTNYHDGANGVTECPIPPGGSRVYRFRARQYGTSWYHSHFSAQYGNGVVGAIHIDGPASLPYDIDLGVFPLQDWYYKSADELVHETMAGNIPWSDNVLFNGTAKHPTTGDGEYAVVTLTPGKRHRLRLINMSTENHFQVSLVNHTMTVIAADMVPVNAMTVDSLFLAVGQRYDVTIDANRPTGNYWFNVTFGGQTQCGWSHHPHPAAIVRYDGAPNALPTNPGVPPVDHQCLDTMDLTPVVQKNVPVSGFVKKPENTLPVTLGFEGSPPVFVWKINGSAVDVDWGRPVLEYVLQNNLSAIPASNNIVRVDGVNQWTYWLVENDPDGFFSLPHPMHLHGHDFFVLGRSPDVEPGSQTRYVFDPVIDLPRLRSSNPVRRDVTMLPAKGWLLLAFRTDNPGAWLFHCHIAWHVSGGFSVDFLERPDELRQSLQADKSDFERVCEEWREYWPTNPYPKIDSGLKQRWVYESDWLVQG
ncbi:hypothetical protein VTJ49DRAFT_3668 [Mycothermus thermophilus]|uniref:laccase n=1 Tax=Humicola insolens TaxID=85995 RepID=A0ABR3V725_HUMIN